MTHLPNTTDPLSRAILDLLCRLPLRWQEVDTENMTATEQEALKRLVRAGLAEQRIRLRAWMDGFEQTVRMQVRVSGEYRSSDVVRRLFDAVPEWLDADGRTRGRFRLESDGVVGVRLTDQGELARQDWEQNSPENPSFVLAFVLGIGPLGLPRPSVPGRVTVESCRVESGEAPEEAEPSESAAQAQASAQASAAVGDITVHNDVHLDPGAVVEAVLARLDERQAAAPAPPAPERHPGTSEAAAGDRASEEGVLEEKPQAPPADHEPSPSVARPEGEPAGEVEQGDFVYRFDPGGGWLIGYEGRRVGMFPNLMGFRYLYELLLIQGRSVSATRLRQHCRQSPVGKAIVTDAEAKEAELGRQLGGGEMTDRKTVRQARELLEDFETRQATCEDPEEAAQLGERIAQLKQYLRTATGLFGQPRPMPGSHLKQDADAVRSCIDRAIGKIKKADKACGLHFKQNIITGSTLSYAPSPPVDWSLL